MRAAVLDALGDDAPFRVAELPPGRPGPGQVRVAVRAIGVNPVDLAVRGGLVPLDPPPSFPLVLGWDLAGTIDAVGPDASGWQPGHEVIGFSPFFDSRVGTYAERVVLDAGDVATCPDHWSAAEGAALPSSGLTAMQALDATGAGDCDELLVVGAAGSVGTLVTQLAIARGIEVTAVVSPRHAHLARDLGVAHVVERGSDVAAAVRATHPDGVPYVVTTARDAGTSVLACVRDGGCLVTIADDPPPTSDRVTVRQVVVGPDAAGLRELSDLASVGLLSVRIAATFPLDRPGDAHDAVAAGGSAGKVVLLP